jgi:Double zinc ribbon/Phospholipase_D-nuclease N-terminal
MNDRRLEHQTSLKTELAFIPKVAWVVSAAVFVAWFVGFIGFYSPHAVHKPGEPPVWVFRLLMVLPGFFLTLFPLLIFYVNKDAKRRNMNRTLWTLLVIFIPNAVGFIVYFLLRQPIIRPCPKCDAQLRTDFSFCPSCGYVLEPHCPNCRKPVEATWTLCAFCGGKLD